MPKTKKKSAKKMKPVQPMPAVHMRIELGVFLALAFAGLSLFFMGLVAFAPAIALAAR